MIPGFVHCREIVESDFVWLSRIPKAKDTLCPFAGFGNGRRLRKLILMEDSPRSVRLAWYWDVFLTAQSDKRVGRANPVPELFMVRQVVGFLANKIGNDLPFF